MHIRCAAERDTGVVAIPHHRGDLDGPGDEPRPRSTLDSRVLYHGVADPPADAIGRLGTIRLFGDVVITSGQAPSGTDVASRLVVSDVRTGATRWSIDESTPIGGDGARLLFPDSARAVGDPSGDWTLITMFQRPLGGLDVEEGVVGLSGVDGDLRWRIPVLRTQTCSCRLAHWTSMFLEDATDATVVVATLAGSTPDDTTMPSVNEAVSTMAFDVPTGRRLWEVPGVWPAAGSAKGRIDGDLLIVERPQLPAADAFEAPAALAAIELGTGTVRWDLADRYPTSSLVSVRGDTVVATLPNGTGILDAATGKLLELASGTIDRCERSDLLFACRGVIDTNLAPAEPAPRLAILSRHGDRASIDAMPGSGECYDFHVWQGLAYCFDYARTPEQCFAIDDRGLVAAVRVPGELVAADDRYALFSNAESTSDEATLSGYAIDRSA